VLKSPLHGDLGGFSMFNNYFKISLRNLWKNKAFSAINIIGLAIGISASLVIFLIVQYDFSFDKFEKDGDRIYRVVTNMKFAGEPFLTSGVPTPLHTVLKSEATGLDEVVPFLQFSEDATVTIPGTNGKSAPFKHQNGLVFTNAGYFNLLPYTWLAGSPKVALQQPNSLVLTEDRARAYFPHTDLANIIGKQVACNDSIINTVTGIVKVPEENTDFAFKEFISVATIQAAHLENAYNWASWGSINSSAQLWIKLAKSATVASIESQLKTLIKKYNTSTNKDEKNTTTFNLQPLSDLHFNATYGVYTTATAHKPTLYGLLTVAAFLLLLGCINFINLTTAQAAQRAKEIGIRKTMGSSRKQLMLQFLNETFFITLIATVLSIGLAPLLLKVFADFIPAGLHFNLLHQPGIILFLIALVITVSFLSGFYPALVLSKYNPVLVLKNQAYAGTASTRRAWLRKGLTVSQFLIAQVFVMATIITSKQIYYMLNTDMGFKKDAIISFYIPSGDKRDAMLSQLNTLTGIQLISVGGGAPSSSSIGTSTMTFKDGKKEIETDVQQKTGDSNYIKLFNLKIVAGRQPHQGDTLQEMMINETYLHILGFTNPLDIINKRIGNRPVVGVLADFHQQSLRTPVKPLMFAANNKYNSDFHIALMPQNIGGATWPATIDKIKAVYKQLFPDNEFYYEFFDESIANYYKSEENIDRLLKWATGLAIFISCMGLLGLVIYTTGARKKEIGVRKVLGATVGNIVSILSADFIRLVLLAFVIAVPVVWWAMQKWMENFAYKTAINWWVFAVSGVGMVVVALITLSVQTIRAARANPVNSLRTE